MTFVDLTALLPLIVLGAAAVVILLVAAFYRNHRLGAGLTLGGFVLAFLVLPVASSVAPRQVTGLLIVDRYALFYMGLLFAAGAAITLLAYGYLENRTDNREEFYLLLTIATLGSSVLVASNHFVSFFLGLEILSVALYGLIAYQRRGERSIEAGLKYLVLAAASAAFLLFGMALIYADLGTMAFGQVASGLTAGDQVLDPLLLAGLGMMVVGIGFKLAVVPFHMWTPDVYEGAPAPVTAFVATVSKGGMFALLLRFFAPVNVQAYTPLVLIFALIAIASMFAGNLLALLQRNVKRILAYSSIAHLGYLLVAFLAGGTLAITAASFYLVAYFVTILGAFGVITLVSGPGQEAMDLEDYRGLYWRRPWLAGIFTVALMSLAGIPLTAGFVGKFYLLTAGVSVFLWLLVISLVVSSSIGLYYYLRIVVVMYLPAQTGEKPAGPSGLPLPGNLALAVLVLLLVGLGIYPAPLIHLLQATVAGLS